MSVSISLSLLVTLSPSLMCRPVVQCLSLFFSFFDLGCMFVNWGRLLMPHHRSGTLVFNEMFCSCRVSTDKRVAQFLCNSRASCFRPTIVSGTAKYCIDQYIFVSLLFARGRHCSAGRATC